MDYLVKKVLALAFIIIWALPACSGSSSQVVDYLHVIPEGVHGECSVTVPVRTWAGPGRIIVDGEGEVIFEGKPYGVGEVCIELGRQNLHCWHFGTPEVDAEEGDQ